MPSPTPSRRVAILQSNYIPWKGYFDLIARVDEFILYDDMQYTKNDWRNRNRIKTPQGTQWISIPVEVKGKFHQRIRDTRIADPGWAVKHWKQFQQNYARAAHFATHRELFEELYRNATSPWLSEVNRRFLTAICDLLGIETRITLSSDYTLAEGKTERLVDLCRQAGAVEYLSGPAARDYMQPELFEAAGMRLSYMDYAGYPEYRQLFPPFEHGVSVLDLVFNEGPDARRFMKRGPAAEDRAAA